MGEGVGVRESGAVHTRASRCQVTVVANAAAITLAEKDLYSVPSIPVERCGSSSFGIVAAKKTCSAIPRH